MRKRSITLLVIIMMIVAACGSGDADDATDTTDGGSGPATTAQDDSSDTTDGGEATTTTEASEPVTVTYYVGGLTSSAPQDHAAEAQGYFAELGIELETVILDGTSQAVQAVAADSGFAFVQGSILDEMLIADANPDAPPLVAIAAGAMRNPVALMFLEGGDLASPEDLAGKTIAVPQGSLSAAYLDVFLESQGISQDDVTIQNIGFDALNAALLTGQVDAIVAFARAIASLSIVAPEQGDTIGYFLFGDYEIASPLTGVIIKKSLLDENPEVARAIAEASTRGLQFCAVQAEECINDFLEVADGRDFDQTLAEWEVALEAQYGIDPEEAAAADPLTLGWFDPDLIAGTLPDLRELFGIESEFDPTTLYTNEFMQQP